MPYQVIIWIRIPADIVAQKYDKYQAKRLRNFARIHVVIVGGTVIYIWLNIRLIMILCALYVVRNLSFTGIKTVSTVLTSVISRIDLVVTIVNEAEGRREIVYQMTMSVARKMIAEGLITEDEYRDFEVKMQEKYRPIIGEVFSNIDLL